MRDKVPSTPGPLTFTDPDTSDIQVPLWRIAATTGAHTRPWNMGRAVGPLPTQRWDPHLPPLSQQPARAVLYAATSLLPAVAETWQAARHIDTATGTPVIVRFIPERPLRLLDVTARGQWAIRNGASASLPHAPRDTCRAWARAIVSAQPDLDGLLAPSTMTGTNVVLFVPGIAALPATPSHSYPAADPAVRAVLAQVAHRIGYTI